jgi:hypothetical protein
MLVVRLILRSHSKVLSFWRRAYFLCQDEKIELIDDFLLKINIKDCLNLPMRLESKAAVLKISLIEAL